MTRHQLTEDLHTWVADHDPHVQAAVQLLVEHGFWLHRPDFVRSCVIPAEDGAYIRWSAARGFVDSRPRASTSELAILDFAVALGENRYQLSILDTAHLQMLRHATARAIGNARQ